MPEQPDTASDWEQYLPAEDREDRLVTLQMPRSALRALERDARAHRQAEARAAATHGDTPLEPGEADLTGQRRDLAAAAPPDRPTLGDPYREAHEIHDRVIADGGLEKDALGAAFNSIVNAAHRGDRRVIVHERGGGRD